jgi:hypothetical protein
MNHCAPLIRSLCLVVSAALLFCPRPLVAQQPPLRPLGTNLTEVTDYSHQYPFVDIFRFSRQWLTQCRNGEDSGCSAANAFDTGEGGQLDLDAHGWVRSLPEPSHPAIFTSAATYWDLPADFPAGRYVVLYQGEGLIQYGLGASKVAAASRSGRDVIDLNLARGGLLLRIAATNPSNYIRDIRVVAVDDEGSLGVKTFSQRFIDRLRPYESLRFMDWMRTNNSELVSWAERPKVTDARYSSDKGVPAEIMIELCNTLSKTPWFTMPHMASDSFVQSFAESTKAKLSSELPVYVEYSNEAWNSLFSQGDYIQQQGQNTWPDSLESGFTKRINWYAKRSAEVCDIWKRVFADAPQRVVCVVASQAANSWTAEEALRCPLWDGAPCVDHGISALAIAPYFGDYIGQESGRDVVSRWTADSDGGVQALFTEIRSGGLLPGGPDLGALDQSFGWIEQNQTVARRFNLQLVAYEGGQHLVGIGAAGNRAEITKLFTSANRDIQMGSIYSSYLDGWNARGGGLFMHFNDISSYSKFGSWGALEGMQDSSSPKFEALRSYALGGIGVDPQPTPRATPPGGSRRRRTISVKITGAGRVSSRPAGISCPGRCAASFRAGSRIRLTAQSARGAKFVKWVGACPSLNQPCGLSMTRAHSTTAVFKPKKSS